MDAICKPFESPRVKFRRIRNFVERNSKPRMIPEQPAIPKGPTFSDQEKINKLSTPIMKKEYIPRTGVAPSALTAVLSPRVAELSVPTDRQMFRKSIEKQIPTSALTYEITPEIEALSKPKHPYQKPIVPPFVKRSALEGKASDRVQELAVPMKREELVKEFIYSINPIALSYRPTKRIKQLAKPQKAYTMKDILKRERKRLARKKISDAIRAKKEAKRKEAVIRKLRELRKKQGL